jgi:hypothetical protein
MDIPKDYQHEEHKLHVQRRNLSDADEWMELHFRLILVDK